MGKRRARLLLTIVGLAVLYVVLGFVVLNTFQRYTETGNRILFVLVLFFAAVAWWYGEDRDRRRALARSKQSLANDPESSSPRQDADRS